MPQNKKSIRHTRLSLKRTVIAVLALSAIFSVAAVSDVYARYLKKKEQQVTVQTQTFYFESDLLAEGGNTYLLTAGTNEVLIQLYNFADELRVSELPVNYTVTVEGDGAMIEGTSSGTLNQDNKTAELILKGLQNGKTYKVTATGKAGYEKTLEATFTVLTAPDGCYKTAEDHGDYVILTIWTENSEQQKVFNITPPAGLIPDNTWQGMEELLTGNEFSVSLEAYSSATYRFFKSDKTVKYKSDDFIVMVGEEEVPDGASK